jgi:hypothetical protein
VGKSEGKTPLGRLGRRWEGNIKMDVRGMGWEVVDWIHLVQYRDLCWAPVNSVMNLRAPIKARNFLKSRAIIIPLVYSYRLPQWKLLKPTRPLISAGEVRNAYKILVGNPEGKRLVGRIGHRWEDNICDGS